MDSKSHNQVKVKRPWIKPDVFLLSKGIVNAKHINTFHEGTAVASSHGYYAISSGGARVHSFAKSVVSQFSS